LFYLSFKIQNSRQFHIVFYLPPAIKNMLCVEELKEYAYLLMFLFILIFMIKCQMKRNI